MEANESMLSFYTKLIMKEEALRIGRIHYKKSTYEVGRRKGVNEHLKKIEARNQEKTTNRTLKEQDPKKGRSYKILNLKSSYKNPQTQS